jgi:hypothetical protein
VAAAERGAVVGVVDFDGLPVVVVVVDVSPELFDLGRVVVVVVVLVGVDFDVDPFDPDFDVVVVVVVVDDLDVDVEPFEDDGLVVVVVADRVVAVVDFGGGEVDFVAPAVEAPGLGDPPREDSVVDVVAAAGALGSSLAVDSSRAWVGPPAAAGGATAGGGMRSRRRAYCMMRAKTGADTWPP